MTREIGKVTGINATDIHGDKSQPQREASLDYFRRGICPILVATDVAARGLDVADISHVLQFDLPGALLEFDSYIHRIGRTGRAGNTGKAVALFVPGGDKKRGENGELAMVIRKTVWVDCGKEVPEWFDRVNGIGGPRMGSNGGGGRGGGRGGGGARDARGGNVVKVNNNNQQQQNNNNQQFNNNNKSNNINNNINNMPPPAPTNHQQNVRPPHQQNSTTNAPQQQSFDGRGGRGNQLPIPQHQQTVQRSQGNDTSSQGGRGRGRSGGRGEGGRGGRGGGRGRGRSNNKGV